MSIAFAAAAFLEMRRNGKRGYVDRAVPYSLPATSIDPQSEAARAGLTALQTTRGRHAAAFEQLLREHGGVGHEKQRVLSPGLPSPFDSCHVVKHPPNLRAGDADRVDVDARDYGRD